MATTSILHISEPFDLYHLNSTLQLSRSKNTPIQGIDVQVEKSSMVNFEQKNIIPTRDVHVYDTKIESNPNKVLFKYTPKQQCDARKLVESIITLIGPAKNPHISAALQMLSVLSARSVNIDPVNQINIDDLFADIVYSKKFTFCIFNLFVEQMADNGMLGQCLQGSSIRYVQIWRLLYE